MGRLLDFYELILPGFGVSQSHRGFV